MTPFIIGVVFGLFGYYLVVSLFKQNESVRFESRRKPFYVFCVSCYYGLVPVNFLLVISIYKKNLFFFLDMFEIDLLYLGAFIPISFISIMKIRECRANLECAKRENIVPW